MTITTAHAEIANARIAHHDRTALQHYTRAITAIYKADPTTARDEAAAAALTAIYNIREHNLILADRELLEDALGLARTYSATYPYLATIITALDATYATPAEVDASQGALFDAPAAPTAPLPHEDPAEQGTLF